MDQIKLKEQIVLYYEKLPSDVQQMFSSMLWMSTLEDISKKYSLTGEQISTLGTETTLVLLGIISISEYKKNIGDEIKISQENIQKILGEVDEKIINTFSSQLSDTFQKNISEESVKNLDSRFINEPLEIQNAISKSDYQRKLYEIGTKNKLPVNIMGSLEEVTIKLMLGKISPSQYEGQLALAIDMPANKVHEIAIEVNEEILKNIRANIVNVEQKNYVDDEVPIPPYAKLASNIEIKGSESKIYADSGIEMISEDKETDIEEEEISKKEDSILDASDIKISEEVPIINKEHLLQNKATQEAFLE